MSFWIWSWLTILGFLGVEARPGWRLCWAASVCWCSRSGCSSSTAKGPQLLPALDQAGHGLPARGHFAVRVGPARPAGELRVGDAPRPLRIARQVGHVLHAADHAALENRDAIGPRLAVREGAPPGDAWVLHCRGLNSRK